MAGNPSSLVRALAFSLAAHALLLWPALDARRSGEVAQPLTAHLRTTATSAPRPDPPPARTERAAASRAEPAPTPRAMTAPADTVAPSVTERAPTANAIAAAGADPAPRDAGGEGAPAAMSAPPVAASAVPREGADADGLRQYRLSLAREARRFRSYPARAREKGLSGTADLRLALGAGGAIEDLRLARSSGHELLDEAALDMLRRAAQRAPLPESLRGRAFALTLPVVFDLRDD